MEIQKVFKIRLYPNQEQEQKLLQTIGACRFVYNYFLEERNKFYAENKKMLPYFVMARELTKLRHETEWMKTIQKDPLGQSLRRLDKAYLKFFREKKGFPKFKSRKDLKQSFQKPNCWKIVDNKLQIQRDLIIRFRGNVDTNVKFGTLIVSRTSTGKWYASMTAKVQVKTLKKYSKPIGIDVGLKTLATLSNGKKYENIQSQKTLQSKLTKAQRSLARKKVGSKRREKARLEVARVYEKIKNVRENHTHQVSSAITAKNHSLIAVEDLNVSGMMRNRKVARAFGDASIRELLKQIQYKQEWKGGQFVKIGRFFPSSKMCSVCKVVLAELPLSVRSWKCGGCGTNHDRDINAAKNILSLAHSERGDLGRVAARRESPISVKRGYTSV